MMKKGFRRIWIYIDMPLLIEALSNGVEKQEAAAWSRPSLPDRGSKSHDIRDNFFINCKALSRCRRSGEL